MLDVLRTPFVVKHNANRSIIRIARSVAPSSSAPASEVTNPPLNSETRCAHLYEKCALVARVIADFMSGASGQPVTVENRVGAAGNLGMDAVAKSVPDGYTLAVAEASNIVINPFLYKSLPFDPISDFSPVGPIAEATLTLSISTSVPARSLGEFVALAKAKAGALNYGSAGVGSISRLSAIQFARASGIEIVHVPYRGIVQAVTDLVAGHIQMLVGPVGPVMGSIPSERLRILAAFSPERCPIFPMFRRRRSPGLRMMICQHGSGFSRQQRPPETSSLAQRIPSIG